MNMNDACCDDEKPQTPTCKTLVQEAKVFMGEMQQKAALLPDEMKAEFQSIMGGNKNWFNNHIYVYMYSICVL